MSTAHQSDLLRRRPSNKAREVLAVVLALPAAALTLFAAYAIIDLATTTYVDAEVVTVQVITIAVGVLAVLAWIGVIALHKSARRDLRAGPRRLVVTALLATLVLAVIASAGAGGWMSFTVYALAVVSAVVALVGALRM